MKEYRLVTGDTDLPLVQGDNAIGKDAKVILDEGRLEVINIHGIGPVWVNGKALKSRTAIREGDVIRVGSHDFHLVTAQTRRRRRHITQTILWTLLTFLFLIIGAWIIIPQFINETTIREAITKKLENATQRDIDISSVEYSYRGSLTINKLSIAESPSIFPPPSSLSFISVDKIVAKIDVWQYIRSFGSHIQLTKAEIHRPEIFLNRTSDGTWNTFDLGKTQKKIKAKKVSAVKNQKKNTKEKQGERKITLPWSEISAYITVLDGSIRFRDDKRNASSSAEGISIAIDIPSFKEPTRIKATWSMPSIDSGKITTAKANLDSELQIFEGNNIIPSKLKGEIRTSVERWNIKKLFRHLKGRCPGRSADIDIKINVATTANIDVETKTKIRDIDFVSLGVLPYYVKDVEAFLNTKSSISLDETSVSRFELRTFDFAFTKNADALAEIKMNVDVGGSTKRVSGKLIANANIEKLLAREVLGKALEIPSNAIPKGVLKCSLDLAGDYENVRIFGQGETKGLALHKTPIDGITITPDIALSFANNKLNSINIAALNIEGIANGNLTGSAYNLSSETSATIKTLKGHYAINIAKLRNALADAWQWDTKNALLDSVDLTINGQGDNGLLEIKSSLVAKRTNANNIALPPITGDALIVANLTDKNNRTLKLKSYSITLPSYSVAGNAYTDNKTSQKKKRYTLNSNFTCNDISKMPQDLLRYLGIAIDKSLIKKGSLSLKTQAQYTKNNDIVSLLINGSATNIEIGQHKEGRVDILGNIEVGINTKQIAIKQLKTESSVITCDISGSFKQNKSIPSMQLAGNISADLARISEMLYAFNIAHKKLKPNGTISLDVNLDTDKKSFALKTLSVNSQGLRANATAELLNINFPLIWNQPQQWAATLLAELKGNANIGIAINGQAFTQNIIPGVSYLHKIAFDGIQHYELSFSEDDTSSTLAINLNATNAGVKGVIRKPQNMPSEINALLRMNKARTKITCEKFDAVLGHHRMNANGEYILETGVLNIANSNLKIRDAKSINQYFPRLANTLALYGDISANLKGDINLANKNMRITSASINCEDVWLWLSKYPNGFFFFDGETNMSEKRILATDFNFTIHDSSTKQQAEFEATIDSEVQSGNILTKNAPRSTQISLAAKTLDITAIENALRPREKNNPPKAITQTTTTHKPTKPKQENNWWENQTANINISALELRKGAARLKNLKTSIALKDGILLSNASLETGGGKTQARGKLYLPKNSFSLSSTSENIDMNTLAAELGGPDKTYKATISSSFTLSGTGFSQATQERWIGEGTLDLKDAKLYYNETSKKTFVNRMLGDINLIVGNVLGKEIKELNLEDTVFKLQLDSGWVTITEGVFCDKNLFTLQIKDGLHLTKQYLNARAIITEFPLLENIDEKFTTNSIKEMIARNDLRWKLWGPIDNITIEHPDISGIAKRSIFNAGLELFQKEINKKNDDDTKTPETKSDGIDEKKLINGLLKGFLGK